MISESNRRKALALIKLVHECDAGMKQGVKYYRTALAHNNPIEATALLKRAARLPFRVEARIQAVVTKYGAAAVNNYLSQFGVTLADMQAELNPLKAYSETLRDNFQNQGWTEEQIAQDIEANRQEVDLDESNPPVPLSYVDNF